MNAVENNIEKPLVYGENINARYVGSNEWIKKGSKHVIRIVKPSEDNRYYILKLYPMDIVPIRMHAYLSEEALRHEWEIL